MTTSKLREIAVIMLVFLVVLNIAAFVGWNLGLMSPEYMPHKDLLATLFVFFLIWLFPVGDRLSPQWETTVRWGLMLVIALQVYLGPWRLMEFVVRRLFL